MVGVFILTVIFVVIIYLYMRRRSKKNPTSENITKYNSSEDYREKF